MSQLPHFPRKVHSRGVGLVTAIFLLVVLAGLTVSMTVLFTTQQKSASLDEQGARAYQAARTGIEWGVYQNAHNNCPGAAGSQTTTFAMPASASSLSGFSVTVTCVQKGTAAIPRYVITAVACNQPNPGCPNPSRNADYVARKLEVVL